MRARWTAWRAALRIARRDAWRNKGRSTLIALMVALPVLAASTVGVLLRSGQADPQDRVALQLGPGAQALVEASPYGGPVEQNFDLTSSGSTSDDRTLDIDEFQRRLAAVLPGSALHLRARAWGDSRVSLGDRTLMAEVSEFDYAAMGSASPLEQLTGRAPTTDDEVVVSRWLARQEHVSIGDRLTVPDASGGNRVVTVVGTVGGLPELGVAEVVARPGSTLPRSTFAADREGDVPVDLNWFVTGPTPVTWAQVQQINAFGGAVLSRAVVARPPAAADFHDPTIVDGEVVGTTAVVVGLVLLQIALMAGPAIAVGTRRNERALAIVAASGGQPRHLRAVVLCGSAVVGLVSSALAATLGVAVAAALIPVLRAVYELPIPRLDVHPLDLLGLVLVGTGTATLAALLPARRVGRLDVTAALTGRRPMTAPRLRVPLLGIVLVAGGLSVAWAGAGWGQQFTAVLGLGLAEVGLVLGSSAVVGLAARAAARASFVARFAFRDAARQRSRTAPALAAVLAAVAGGMTALVFAHSSAEVSHATFTSSIPVGSMSVGITSPGRTDAERAASVQRVQKVVGEVLPGAATAVQSRPTDGDLGIWGECSGPDRPATLLGCGIGGYEPVVVDPSAAPVLVPDRSGAVQAALAAGRVVAFDAAYVHNGRAALTVGQDEYAQGGRRVDVPAVLVRARDPLQAALVPTAVAHRLGVRLEPTGLAVTAREPITPAQAGRVRFVVEQFDPDSYVGVERGYRAPDAWIYLCIVAAAALVALIGTFTAVGLAAAESRADLGTLASVGAAPATRRRLGAAQASAITVPGALLGLVSGTAGAWVLVRLQATANANWQDPDLWRLRIPWDQAAALGLGIPLLAVVLGFVTVRSRLVPVRRLGE
ncbi:FtsX-like permease family protein [Spongisporangium articulatum]|uniref:FtsX-like permease family protein n=1 Tax=Spongisporangium articulatum TaxID=3362603 RepID=A0ABW8AIJ4_9ACTN